MAKLTSQEANELANDFSVMAHAVEDYRIRNSNTLEKHENKKFRDLHRTLLNYSDDLYTLSAIIIIDDAKESLSTIGKVTAQIKKIYKALQNVQEGINIAVSIVTLGAALFSNNPKAIGDAIGGLVATLKK